VQATGKLYYLLSPTIWMGRRDRDRILVGIITTHAISAYPTDIESSNPAQARCKTLYFVALQTVWLFFVCVLGVLILVLFLRYFSYVLLLHQ